MGCASAKEDGAARGDGTDGSTAASSPPRGTDPAQRNPSEALFPAKPPSRAGPHGAGNGGASAPHTNTQPQHRSKRPSMLMPGRTKLMMARSVDMDGAAGSGSANAAPTTAPRLPPVARGSKQAPSAPPSAAPSRRGSLVSRPDTTRPNAAAIKAPPCTPVAVEPPGGVGSGFRRDSGRSSIVSAVGAVKSPTTRPPGAEPRPSVSVFADPPGVVGVKAQQHTPHSPPVKGSGAAGVRSWVPGAKGPSADTAAAATAAGVGVSALPSSKSPAARPSPAAQHRDSGTSLTSRPGASPFEKRPPVSPGSRRVSQKSPPSAPPSRGYAKSPVATSLAAPTSPPAVKTPRHSWAGLVPQVKGPPSPAGSVVRAGSVQPTTPPLDPTTAAAEERHDDAREASAASPPANHAMEPPTPTAASAAIGSADTHAAAVAKEEPQPPPRPAQPSAPTNIHHTSSVYTNELPPSTAAGPSAEEAAGAASVGGALKRGWGWQVPAAGASDALDNTVTTQTHVSSHNPGGMEILDASAAATIAAGPTSVEVTGDPASRASPPSPQSFRSLGVVPVDGPAPVSARDAPAPTLTAMVAPGPSAPVAAAGANEMSAPAGVRPATSGTATSTHHEAGLFLTTTNTTTLGIATPPTTPLPTAVVKDDLGARPFVGGGQPAVSSGPPPAETWVDGRTQQVDSVTGSPIVPPQVIRINKVPAAAGAAAVPTSPFVLRTASGALHLQTGESGAPPALAATNDYLCLPVVVGAGTTGARAAAGLTETTHRSTRMLVHVPHDAAAGDGAAALSVSDVDMRSPPFHPAQARAQGYPSMQQQQQRPMSTAPPASPNYATRHHHHHHHNPQQVSSGPPGYALAGLPPPSTHGAAGGPGVCLPGTLSYNAGGGVPSCPPVSPRVASPMGGAQQLQQQSLHQAPPPWLGFQQKTISPTRDLQYLPDWG